MESRIIAIVAMLTLSVPAGAGTASDPEATDPAGDTVDELTGLPDTGPGTSSLDIRSTWFAETQSKYAVTIAVEDLDGVYRVGRNVHHYQVSWATQGHEFSAFITRASTGETDGRVDISSVTETDGTPRTDDGTATLTFDETSETISLEVPRLWTVTTANDTLTFNYDKGTILTDIVVHSFDGTGAGVACFVCVGLDITDPANTKDFTFEEECDGGKGEVRNRRYTITGDHADVTTSDMTGKVVQGDTVEVRFRVTGCTHVTLVSYTTPDDHWDASEAHLQEIWRVDGALLEPGWHTLTVPAPDCYFQVDFIIGAPIETFDPPNGITYSKQGRLMDAANGGVDAC